MTEKPVILVSGGAGYIGTHTVVVLLEAGYKVIILDNLDNSSEEAIKRVRKISNCEETDLVFHDIDLTNYSKLETFFEQEVKGKGVDACIHFAALKAVGESVRIPLHYYYNNLVSALNLLNLLDKHECRNFVFSSSATVYGDPQEVPIPERHSTSPTNPYGKTKDFIEKICEDLTKSKADNEAKPWNIALLRYFNPIGAHPSGLIGEDPQGFPNNLIPFVAQVAVGRRSKLQIFGNDWPTKDGTGVRDYIHVVDLAEGHVAAIKRLIENKDKNLGVETFNLGTGNGVSVLEVVNTFQKASGKEIPYEIVGRRAGDIGTCYADPKKAFEVLKWEAKLNIDDMCRDTWNWQSKNPHGFRSEAEVKEAERKAAAGEKVERKADIFQLYGY